MANKKIEEMTLVEIARNLVEMGFADKAIDAYTGALKQGGLTAGDKMEAACAVLQFGQDYKLAYKAFLELYEEGSAREDVFSILCDAFYSPNVKLQKKRYEKNLKLLKKYPYLFRKDFPKFEELPVKFFPFDDNGVIPFFEAEERFDTYIDFDEPVIRHYFFRDLTKPVLTHDIYSQYELEYLRDNVRRSDWAARENHIYLHYSDWGVFCSYLQCLDMKPVLEEQKVVFLIGEEESLYPIDFKERFGIDYSQYAVKPFSIREINKLIWHTQLGFHNGGDFFNEIMDGHPNLLADTSRFLGEQTELIERVYAQIKDVTRDGIPEIPRVHDTTLNEDAFRELFALKDLTMKDVFVAVYLTSSEWYYTLDKNSRISPALLFQPHFANMQMGWASSENGGATVTIGGIEEVKNSPLFRDFKYIKTFTPMRRPTTSMAATLRFVDRQIKELEEKNLEAQRGGSKVGENREETIFTIDDMLVKFMINRSFMVDYENRMFRDSRLVRFEDGKLNPAATFTALAEFLDIPYSETMKSCTGEAALTMEGSDQLVAFDLGPVYRTYDEYADRDERVLLEYSLRDVYRLYGYGFNYYNGDEPTDEQLDELLCNANLALSFVEKAFRVSRIGLAKRDGMIGEVLDEWFEKLVNEHMTSYREQRQITTRLSKYAFAFYSPQGNRLHFMEQLKLDPALLEQPLYH